MRLQLLLDHAFEWHIQTSSVNGSQGDHQCVPQMAAKASSGALEAVTIGVGTGRLVWPPFELDG
jgi:hypothetical protein